MASKLVSLLEDNQRTIREVAARLDRLEGRLPTVNRAFWTPREVAARYGIECTQTVIDWIKAGKITATKDDFSKRWMVPQSEIDYLDSVGGKPSKRSIGQAA